jgi:hypothetical protein
MLALIGRLHQAGLAAGNQGVLDKLLSQRPELTSVGFLLWVAQQEAAAGPGEYKQVCIAVIWLVRYTVPWVSYPCCSGMVTLGGRAPGWNKQVCVEKLSQVFRGRTVL